MDNPSGTMYETLFGSPQDLAERKRLKNLYDLRAKMRLRDLRAMPYASYLLTPEWRMTRDCYLASVGHRCQVCNTSNLESSLHVHHRTYERLGEELFEDLLALCEGCHQIFHEHGKLAK